MRGVAFFDAGGVILSLFGRKEFAKDAGVENSKPGFSGVALAYNVPSEAEADFVLQAAVKAGGKILKPAQRAFWDDWYGHFDDPEGHIWEVAHNPGFTFDDHGNVVGRIRPGNAAILRGSLRSHLRMTAHKRHPEVAGRKPGPRRMKPIPNSH
jgi:predicted enzyme related to lactoylglutathione lyase